MRKIFAFLFFIVTQLCLSQITFTSPLTQHFPSGEIETINRIISFKEGTIVIDSETVLKERIIQTFYIQEYSQEENSEHGQSDFFVCSTKDGLYITYFLIPVVDKVEFIEVVQPQQLTLNARRYRFLVD